MAENSKIEWTDHTFNPWIGCTKVSNGCKNCYAEALMDKRFGKVEWGPSGVRQRTSDENWRKPLAWNRKAESEGRRRKVFCASLADVFELNINQFSEMQKWQMDLYRLIDATPHLDWLLLTKRPENVIEMLPLPWEARFDGFPPNVWIGTSVEDQQTADERIPHLLKIPAAVRFLSMEPLLGPVNLGQALYPDFAADDPRHFPKRNGIDWVICGGESGPNARPMHPDWVRSIRGQCRGAGVQFFFKQGSSANWPDHKAFESFPADLKIREFPG